MRRMVQGVLVAFVYGGVASAQGCVQPAEGTAFNVVALKSALMVGALSCNQGEQYDAFMTQFQSYILSEQHVMDRYFNRTSGMYGQTQEDSYVTVLANTQSQTSLSLGSGYCDDNAQVFSDIAALSTPDDLNQYIASHTPTQPATLVPCAVTQAAASQPDPAQAEAAEKALVQAQPTPPAPAPVHAAVAKNAKAPAAARKSAKQAAPALAAQSV
jgi:hypothetical protein